MLLPLSSGIVGSDAFIVGVAHGVCTTTTTTSSFELDMAKNNNSNVGGAGAFGFLNDIQGMFNNFDDVIDDFLFKRMGAGEQWYGKRKYNPSGKFDGDYNGMGRSDFYKIEIAKIQKEEMELKRQRRLAEQQQQQRRREQQQ